MDSNLFNQLKNGSSGHPSSVTVAQLNRSVSKVIGVDDIKNTEESWKQDGRKIIDAANQIDSESPCLSVIVNIGERTTAEMEEEDEQFSDHPMTNEENAEPETAPTDVTLNLQYFFPYCDQALRDHPNLLVFLVVICPNKNDQQRAVRYLSAVSQAKKRLCITTAIAKGKASFQNARLIPVSYDTRYIGALLPLFCVGKQIDVTPGLDDNSKTEDLSVEKLASYTDAFYQYVVQKTRKDAFDELGCPQRRMFFAAGYAAIEGIEKILYGGAPKRHEDLKKDIQNLTTIINTPSSSPKEKEKAKNSLERKEKALSDNALELKRRTACVEAFWNLVHNDTNGRSRLTRISFLTQVIWLCSLYHLLDQGELFDNKTLSFRHSQIDLILWDSIAYGEGILQLLENCCLYSQHRCGYLSVYFHRIGLKQISKIGLAAERRMRIFYRYRTSRNDAFEELPESVYLEFNVTDMGRDNNYCAQGIETCSQESLLSLFSGAKLSDSPQDVAHHYGMPLFYKIVLLKRGRFICTTPSDINQAKRLIGRRVEQKDETDKYTVLDSAQAWTGYQILLPLLPCLQVEPTPVKCSDELLDSSFLRQECMPSQYSCQIVEKERILPSNINVSSATEKIMLANEICNKLEEFILTSESQNTVYLLKMMKMSSLALEVYLKGLFIFIARRAEKDAKKAQEKRLFIRLLFTDEYSLSEAVRRFSIFYDRAGTNKWMEEAQIAFCSAESRYSPIRLILAGKDIQTAYVTAKQYMHYNVDIDSGFLLSQIEYLCRVGKKKTPVTPQPLFPFDLVPLSCPLSIEDSSERGGIECSDFERKIENILGTDLQEEAYGCKICNAHVRLGSKIHIQDFYDAELLFQSVANVYRFAYMLVEQIIQCIKDKVDASRHIYLIGYENYASILVEEVVRLLCKTWPKNEKNIRHFQYIKTNDAKEKIVDMDCKENTLSADAIMVTILPVGTTLSTIYKIKNAFFRKYAIEIPSEQQYNFALILVGPLLSTDTTDKLSTPDNKAFPDMFWTECEDQTVELTPESVLDREEKEGKTIVRWFFMVRTRWMLPDQCLLCINQNSNTPPEEFPVPFDSIPLSQVDKTSTIPKLIFPAMRSSTAHGISFSLDSGKNVNRLEGLKDCIEYGHIQRGTNHYQYYIDYQKYYQVVRRDCIEWFREKQAEIDHQAFNIVISPLQYDNCRFVKDAVDHLFLHSLRFIYISLRQAYREEIRSRFSYIAKEYRDACAGLERPQYNVYYIDYSVVSGESLHRSKALIQMLLNDADPSAPINIFEKVILLTNRSSFDTAATFVRDPKTDFLAYSTLCIPSYNTLSNRCPACEIVETYQTIAKCSATNELFWHYHDLEQKHKLKTLDEHCRSIEALHFSKVRYLSCFYQSLVHRLDLDFANQIDFDDVKSAFETGFNALTSCDDSLPLKGLTLASIADASGNGTAVKMYYKNLIAGRNWRRLICTHETVLLTERLGRQSDNEQHDMLWDPVSIQAQMWDVMVARMHSVTKSLKSGEVANRFELREWLISYIKAFSREYPAKIAPIRRAAHTLLELLFWELVSQAALPDDLWRKALGEDYDGQNVAIITSLLRINVCDSDSIADAAERLQLYQLYLVLGKRLCDLQSNLLLQFPVLKQIDCFLMMLQRKRQIEAPGRVPQYSKLFDLSDSNRLQSDYLYMIKWAAMSSNEEAKAFLLQELVKCLLKASGATNHDARGGTRAGESNLKEAAQQEKEDAHPLISKRFAEVLRQENTRVLYTGIKRLNEMVKDTQYSWEFLLAEVERATHCSDRPHGAIGPYVNSSGENNERKGGVGSFSKILPQNPLYDLFKYLKTDLALGSKNDPPPLCVKELLAALLGVYRLIEILDDRTRRETEKDYVDIYSQLCFFLGKLGNHRNCCLIHRTNETNTIIAQYLTDQIDNLGDKIQKILNYCGDSGQLDEGTLYNTVVEYSPQNGAESALVLALRIKQNSDIAYHQKVYAVLFDIKKDSDPKMAFPNPQATRSHYLLFMRQQLQASLERDLYALHHFKLSRDDVAPLRASNSTAPLCILHLSDLHISKKNEETILSLIKSQEKKLKGGNPDLLVVTGDVVQGTGSAIDLEENYNCAKHVLYAIAKALWAERDSVSGQEMLRSDWKKRIIIIPGNHDYSSMNELVASSTLRVTTLGIPTQRNGSPMSRYAYYIQFLQDFLDIDSRQSIRNNLNSIIEYSSPGFMVRFIALNSVAEVGPLRNNKVQLDERFIDQLPKRPTRDGFLNICLSHHTWCYVPNYFADRYGTKGLTKPAIELAEQIIALCKEGRNKLLLPNADQATVKADINRKIEKLIATSKTEYNCLSKQLIDSEISQDILYLKEHWPETTNERCQHIIFDYILNLRMAEADIREYKKRIQELISTKGYPISIMLGGHTHEAGWTVSINHGQVRVNDLSGEYACAEGPRFYNEKEGILQFGKLFIAQDGTERTVEYQFVPGTSIRSLEHIF